MIEAPFIGNIVTMIPKEHRELISILLYKYTPTQTKIILELLDGDKDLRQISETLYEEIDYLSLENTRIHMWHLMARCKGVERYKKNGEWKQHNKWIYTVKRDVW